MHPLRISGLQPLRLRHRARRCGHQSVSAGGTATIEALAALLGRRFKPLNPAHGVESPPSVAWIDEERCIGCARCLSPCPVDAIVGASKFLHTVIADRCTGCELCLPTCPVDCIEMRPGPPPRAGQRHETGNDTTHMSGACRRERSSGSGNWPRSRLLPQHARPRRDAQIVNPQKRRAIFERLREHNPAPRTELKFRTPFELLIAVILSAQATDKSVNGQRPNCTKLQTRRPPLSRWASTVLPLT